jgi:hypothetical protein
MLTAEDITPSGVTILEAACRGEDIAPMLEAWADCIYETPA